MSSTIEVRERIASIKQILEESLKNEEIVVGKQRIRREEAEKMLEAFNEALRKPEDQEIEISPEIIPTKLIAANKDFRALYVALR